MKAHKKEVKFTVWMVFIFVAVGNSGIFFSMFPSEGISLFGFPIRYIIPILLGWFGVLILTIVSGRIGNQLDDEISKEVEETEIRKEVS